MSFTTGQEYIDLPEFGFAEDTSSPLVRKGAITISLWMKLKEVTAGIDVSVFEWEQIIESVQVFFFLRYIYNS